MTPGESLSRPELAKLVNAWLFARTRRVAAMTAGYVGKLERGVILWPHQQYRDALRAVLVVETDRQLGFRRPAHDPAEVWPAQAEAADRGRFGLHRDRVDDRLVASMEQTADVLAGMYLGGDLRATSAMVAAFADQLLRLLDADAPADLRARLASVTTAVHAQVGLMAYHDDQPPAAYRHLATACQTATGAVDPAVRARALGASSYLFSAAPRGGRGGDPARALALLDQASALTPGDDHLTRGWLAVWRADHLATLGDLSQARADVEVAAEALDRHDPGPRGLFGGEAFRPAAHAHLASVRGVVLGLAGEPAAAERTFDAVHELVTYSRRAVATYAHTALTRARSGEAEGACEALRRCVCLALRERYPMGLRRALGVRASFPPRWDGLPCVRDLDDLLTAAGAGTTWAARTTTAAG